MVLVVDFTLLLTNTVLLVSAGDQLILGRPEDQTLQSLQLDNHKSSIILAMAHDPLRQQLYFSDKMASGRTAIYSTDLKDLQAASQPALVVESESLPCSCCLLLKSSSIVETFMI